MRTNRMVSFRPFLNGDITDLIRIWNDHGPDSGLVTDLSVDLFDRLVLSKPYFNRQGLIAAVEDNRVIGFVHVGFGPNADETDLDFHLGIVSMLLVHADYTDPSIADELLKRGEQYLRDRGAQEIVAVGFDTACPFYLGLYGGSQLPGILESDIRRRDFFTNSGYQSVGRIALSKCDLNTLHVGFDRDVLRLRRSMRIDYLPDPKSRSWWDACTQGFLPQLQVTATPTAGGTLVASATFWDMQSLLASDGPRTMGLSKIEASDTEQDFSVVRYLLLESFRYLQQQEIAFVQTQADEEDEPTKELFQAVGLKNFDVGLILKK